MAHKEKRQVNRKGLNLRASIEGSNYDGSDDSVPVRTLNLSAKGALIESTQEIFVGSVCTFTFLTDNGREASVQGRIVWVKANEDHTYDAGVVFRNLSPEAEYLISLQLVRA